MRTHHSDPNQEVLRITIWMQILKSYNPHSSYGSTTPENRLFFYIFSKRIIFTVIIRKLYFFVMAVVFFSRLFSSNFITRLTFLCSFYYSSFYLMTCLNLVRRKHYKHYKKITDEGDFIKF